MKIIQNPLYTNYRFNFGNSNRKNAPRISRSNNVQSAVEAGIEIYKMSKEDINSLKYPSCNAIKILPLKNQKSKTSAQLQYKIYAKNAEPVCYSYIMYLSPPVSDCKLSKTAYAADYSHEYQHYLYLRSSNNMYVNLYKNLKNNYIYSPGTFMDIIESSSSVIDYFGGELMRNGIYKMFGEEGKCSCKKNYGLLLTPKEITDDTIAKSTGFKDSKDMKDKIENFNFDTIIRHIVHKDRALMDKYYAKPEQAHETIKKIIRHYLRDSFFDEYNSYQTQYTLCAQLGYNDYGAVYNARYNNMLSSAFDE